MSSILALVQRTALSNLTRDWTDNISNILSGHYNIRSCVFVSNANCSHINIYSYHDPLTEHGLLPPAVSPAHIKLSLIVYGG
jgi:hypothetical protein